MRVAAIFGILFLALSTISMALPDFADAARIGGGKSFGGKPFMNTPARPPAQARQQPGMAQNQQSAPRSGMFGGMGGLLGGLLAGTLLGSLLSGNGFAGGGFMDILLLALLAYLAWRIFSRMRAGTSPAPAGASQGGRGFFGQANNQNDPGMSRVDSNSAGWGALRNQESVTQSAPLAVPQDFNVDEFMRGAKMVYTRLQQAWDKRDLQDISHFATPAVMNELQKQLADDPNPSHTEIMLVNATLQSVEREGDTERAEVYFDVLMREDPSQPTPTQVREIWHFMRVGAGNWKLDGIQQVD